jgi:hypothetical protein
MVGHLMHVHGENHFETSSKLKFHTICTTNLVVEGLFHNKHL